MFTKDIKTETTATALIVPVTITSNTNGTGFDTQPYAANMVVDLSVSAGTGTTPTLDVKIQDSADNSTFADVSPAIAFTQSTTTANIQSISVDKRLVRRYVRAVSTVSGTTPSYIVSANIRGYKQIT